MCGVLKMIFISVVRFQKYYVISEGPQLIFQSLSKHSTLLFYEAKKSGKVFDLCDVNNDK